MDLVAPVCLDLSGDVRGVTDDSYQFPEPSGYPPDRRGLRIKFLSYFDNSGSQSHQEWEES